MCRSRILVSTIVALAFMGGQLLQFLFLSSESSMVVNDAVVTQLPDRTPSGHRRDHRIVYFLHIHKSGGTTLCQMAAANNETVDVRRNCNVQRNYQCCSGANNNDITLASLKEFASTTHYTFVGVEGILAPVLDHEHYYYVLQLREGYHRYVSHYQHQVRMFRTGGMSFGEWWKGQIDNFGFRQVCGPACVGTFKFQLTQAQIVHTLQRLEEFDQILILEDEGSRTTFFRDVMHWQVPGNAALRHSNAAPKKTKQESKHSDDNDHPWDPLMVALDDLLYAYTQQYLSSSSSSSSTSPLRSWDELGQRLSSSPVWDAVTRYLHEGADRGCRSPCCAPQCSKTNMPDSTLLNGMVPKES